MTQLTSGSIYSGPYSNIVRVGHQYYGNPSYPAGDGSIAVTGDNILESEDIGNLRIGGAGGIYGYALLDGSTYGVEINVAATPYSGGGTYGTVAVGANGGEGVFVISNGAVVTSTNNAVYDGGQQAHINAYYNLNVGNGNGSIGVLTITGDGSELTANGVAARLNIGRNGGTGTVNVLDGGNLGGQSIDLGRRDGATGTINVDGAGSTLTISDVYGQFGIYNGNDYSGNAGSIRVGRQTGNGTLNITNGGVVTVENTDGVTDSPRVDIGRGLGSTGTVLVSGTGSELNVTQNGLTELSSPGIRVGAGGYGLLTVENGGTVNVTGDDAFLGVSDRFGYADYSGRTSRVVIQSGGVINVTGGDEDGGFVQVGQVNGQRGAMSIDGAGSELNLTSSTAPGLNQGAFLSIGNRSEGTLTVTNGGSITIDGNNGNFPGINIGRGEDDGSVRARGTLVIDGAGSSVTVLGDNLSEAGSSGFVAVGSRPNAEGSLTISNGGVMNLQGSNSQLVVGNREGADGDVIVTGTGSALSVGGEILVGVSGDGTFLVEDGATASAGTLRIGQNGEADMQGTFTGDLFNDGFLDIGDSAFTNLTINGSFNMENGAVLIVEIDDFAGGIGDTLTISGDGTFNTRQSFLAVAIDNDVSITTGDVFVLATVGGTISADTRTVFDINRGVQLTLSADGSNLILTADEDALIINEVVGDANANLLNGSENADLIQGLGGDDTLIGLGGDDNLEGGDDDDLLNGGQGADTLDGGTGTNTVTFEDSASGVRADLANGIAGSSEAAGDVFTNIQNMIGSSNNDRFFGTDGANLFDMGDGNDSVIAGGGDDTAIGGQGADTLFGLDGNDILRGGTEIDSLSGGDDDDTLEGGAGADVLNGGRDNDTATYINATNSIVVDLRRPDGSVGDAAGDTFAFIENIQGTNFADNITGNNIANVLQGESGSDRLFGLRGDDILDGGLRVDFLTGGDGNDTLTGGAQRDFFIFDDDDESGVGAGNRDIITDFSQADGENIRLNRIDGDSTTSGDQDLFFVGGNAFSNTAGEVRFEQVSGNTIVQLDTNGDGAANMEIELTGLFTLVGGDFSF